MIITQLNEISPNLNMIIGIILAIVIPLMFIKLIKMATYKVLDEDTLSSRSMDTLSKIVRNFVFVIIFLAILEVLGIDLHSLILSVGLVSLAVTLAAKDTLSNVISGIIILIEKRFVIGDMIEIDGHKGQVKKIGFKSVELYYKKTYMVIPNVLFTTKPFINHTRNGYYAIFFDVRMLNKYNLDEKISQLENVLDNSDLILKEPKYLIKIKNITTNGVDITVKAYIDNPLDDTKVTAELIKKIKREIVLEDMY
ncbi:MAG: hypothetical protein BZ135_00185 [Methanosphaera sp. rholeuAM6]|nr:MAG: hypothetical protein BZ135_00185 [Methanosphaera sp. rholeuAM6]